MTLDLETLLVRPDDTLLAALKIIDRAGVEIAFVAERGKVIGTLTDGDVRRALIGGATLESRAIRRAMQKHFTFVSPSVGRAEVLDTMRARDISQIPVLDRAGRLIGLHLLKELVGVASRPNWAVIMAGGVGVRLRPLTESVPKPMLSVAGRPILERLVLHLVGHGIHEIFLSVSYLGHVIEDHFGDGEQFGCRIRYLRERKPLGTGGSLSLLPSIPQHPVLVLNGDLVTQARIDGILDAHAAGRCDATICVRPYQTHIPFGVVDVEDGKLVGFREKPTEQLLVNAGIYVLSPAALKRVPKGRPFPITQIFEDNLTRKRKVGVHLVTEEWMDIGRHDELKRARGLS